MTGKPSVAILAGGLATRLGALAAHTPKVLLEVASRPFLCWQLELLHSQGVDDVVLCLGHHAEQISSRLSDCCPRGMRVQISLDGPSKLDTGGALRRALPLLSDPFMVMYGDSFLRCDYVRVHEHFLQARAGLFDTHERPLGLMTIFRNDERFDSSNVVFEQGRITHYSKQYKHPDMHHIDWGLGELMHEAFEPFAQRAHFDLAELYTGLVAKRRLIGHEVKQRFFEIGSAAGLEELRVWLPNHLQELAYIPDDT